MNASETDLDQSGDLVVVRPHQSDLSGQELQELVDQCVERIRYDGARHFIFDLDQVQFMDSACLGTLVLLLQEVEHVRGKIALAGCGESIQFLFKVTRLDRSFTICEDVDEAKLAA